MLAIIAVYFINIGILKLTKEEKLFKKKCLEVYESERNNLNYVKINIESFRPIKKYDYSNPPHSVVLFYKIFSFFSWHPRVDADDPKLVCETIVKSKIFK